MSGRDLLRGALRLPARAAVLLIRAYQLVVSPMLGPVCRYAPSCSSYTAQAITTHGLVRGVALGSWRLLRCNPWSRGGWDPVPGRVAERHPRGTTSGHPHPADRTRI